MSIIFTILCFALIAKGVNINDWHYILCGAIISVSAALCNAVKIIFTDDESNEVRE